MASFSEPQRAPVLLEERQAKRFLKRLDLQRDAGLTQVERLGGARDAATLGDGAEDLQLMQIHKHTFAFMEETVIHFYMCAAIQLSMSGSDVTQASGLFTAAASDYGGTMACAKRGDTWAITGP